MVFNIVRIKLISNSVIFSHIWNPIRTIHNSYSNKQRLLRCVFGDKIFSRDFHNTLVLKAKTFQERENEYAHEVMENIPLYNNSIIKSSALLKSMDLDGISSNTIRKFSQVTLDVYGSSVTLESNEFFDLVTEVSLSLSTISDNDLFKLLHSLCLWPPSPKSWSHNFKLLWNKIDEECCLRLNKWDTNQKFLVAEYFFSLRLNRISMYNRTFIADLIRKIDSLSDHHIVQLMFYINLQRKVPILHDAFIQRLQDLINSISIQELGIICLAFFKTETSVKDPFFNRAVLQRFVDQLGQTNTATVAAILKFLRKSMCFKIIDDYIYLLHRCVGHIPSWDVLTTVHVALLASECRVYHPLLLDAVTQHVASHISTEARIKDCVKLLQAITAVGHDPGKNFLDMFFLELRKESRKHELEKFKRDLVYTSLFCAYLGHYDLHIIKTVLEPSYVKDYLTKYPEMEAAIAEVDCCVEIECPDYTGPRLSLEHRQILTKRRGNITTAASKNNLQARLIDDSISTLKELGLKEENLLVRHIMPHCFSPYIILRLNPSTTESLEEICSKISPLNILYPPYKEEKWICLVVASSFSFAYRSKKKTGVTEMRLRQLSKLGYRTVFVPYFDIPMNSVKRLENFKKILTEVESDCNAKCFSEIK